MADNVGSVVATVELDTRKASQQWRRFQGEMGRANRNMNGLGNISRDARQFESALGAATNRVTAFAAAAGVFTLIERSITSFVGSIVEVDQALARINVNLNQTQEGLKAFGQEIFNIARQTGQTFQVTAKAAEELARQGLPAEETVTRLKDALILSRIAGIGSADAVETLTAAINSFQQSALTSTEIVNKFAAVDTKFAVSSKDLSEAISRVGSTAQSAGVGINELLALVTSLQQTTARGGATIGNGLKTIFTRIQAAPETISALQSVGVAIQDTSGQMRSAIDILRDYTVAREKVGEAERQTLDRTVAGTFQINILKAALADLSRENSIYERALKTSNQATDEAIRKNAQLNQTLSSLFNQTSVTIKELFSTIGNQSLGPLLSGLFKGIETIRSYFSGNAGDDIGKSLGDGIIKGLSSVLSGPVLVGVAALAIRTLGKVFSTLGQEARALFQINNAAGARARIQERINMLLGQATAAEYAQFKAATSVLAQKQAILRIQERISALEITGSPLQNALLTRGVLGGYSSKALRPGTMPNMADPIQSAISREIKAGVPASSIYIGRDARVASPGNPAGLLVANTRDEPRGAFQGVNRAIAEGANPKTYGTIPNYAPLKSAQEIALESIGLGPKKYEGKAPTALSLAMAQTSGATSELKKTEKVLKLVNRGFETLAKERAARLSETLKLVDVGFQGLKTNLSARTMYSSPIGPNLFSKNLIETSTANAKGQALATKYLMGGSLGTNVPMGVVAAAAVGGNLKVTYPRESSPYIPFGEKNPNRPYQFTAEDMAARNAKAAQLRQIRRERDIKREAAEQARRDRNFSRAQMAGIGLSFASGFIPEGEGGTAQGMAQGFGKGAAQGAGLGALLGPKGLAIGGIIGGLVGLFTKLSKSAQELNAVIDNSINTRNQEREALDNFLIAQDELNNAVENNAEQSTLRRLTSNVEMARRRLTPEAAGLAGIEDKEERSKKLNEDLDKRALANAKDELRKSLTSGTQITPSQIRQTFGKDFISSLTPENLKSIGAAASGTFDVGPLKTNAKTGQTNIKEFVSAQESYKKSVEELTPILKDIVDVSSIAPKNLASFVQQLRKAILEARKIEEQTPIAANVGRPGLAKGAFLSSPNLDIYKTAAMTGRSPRATVGQKGKAQFAFFQELMASGAISKEQLESQPLFKQSRALAQRENLSEGVAAFIQNLYPGSAGTLRSGNGKYNQTSINRWLDFASKSTNKYTATNASLLKNLMIQSEQGIENVGLNKLTMNSAYAGSRNLTKIEKIDNTPSVDLQTQKRVVDINVKIDGALNLIEKGMDSRMAVLIQSEVNQAIINATSKYFKSIEPGLAEYEARISKLEGTPLPPKSLQNMTVR